MRRSCPSVCFRKRRQRWGEEVTGPHIIVLQQLRLQCVTKCSVQIDACYSATTRCHFASWMKSWWVLCDRNVFVPGWRPESAWRHFVTPVQSMKTHGSIKCCCTHDAGPGQDISVSFAFQMTGWQTGSYARQRKSVTIPGICIYGCTASHNIRISMYIHMVYRLCAPSQVA